MREARQARAEAMQALLAALARTLPAAAAAAQEKAEAVARRAAAFAGRQWRRYAGWRERVAAVRELALLDDRSLKDLGLHRSEIASAVYGRDAAPEGRVAAFLLHKPPPKRSTGREPATRCAIEKRAA